MRSSILSSGAEGAEVRHCASRMFPGLKALRQPCPPKGWGVACGLSVTSHHLRWLSPVPLVRHVGGWCSVHRLTTVHAAHRPHGYTVSEPQTKAKRGEVWLLVPSKHTCLLEAALSFTYRITGRLWAFLQCSSRVPCVSNEDCATGAVAGKGEPKLELAGINCSLGTSCYCI